MKNITAKIKFNDIEKELPVIKKDELIYLFLREGDIIINTLKSTISFKSTSYESLINYEDNYIIIGNNKLDIEIIDKKIDKNYLNIVYNVLNETKCFEYKEVKWVILKN